MLRLHQNITRNILTRTTTQYSLPSNWHHPSYHPINPSPPWISHHGCWRAPFQHPVSTSRWSHFHRTPQQSVRYQVDPWSLWFTLPPRTHLCPELWQSLTTCSPVLTQPSPCRSFRSDKDSSSSPYAILLVRTSSLCQGLLQNCAPLVPTPNPCATTLQTSQATSDSREALEFHIHGFHREVPSIFWLYLDSSHCWLSLKGVTLHPDSQYHYVTSTCTTLCSTRLFKAQCSKPHHFWLQYGICIPLLPFPWNCIGHEASFHF